MLKSRLAAPGLGPADEVSAPHELVICPPSVLIGAIKKYEEKRRYFTA